MAFVTRGERKFFPSIEVASGRDVGPGSYIKSEMDLGVGMKYSVAPFCSTSRRVLGNEDSRRTFHTPGPGSYGQVRSAFKTGESYYSGGKAFQNSSNFDSKTRRFEAKSRVDDTPGPGSYEIKSKLSKQRRKYPSRKDEKNKNKNIEYVKVFTQPSIPSSNSHRFGADQKPSPGPGSYKASYNLEYHIPQNSSMFKSSTKRNIMSSFLGTNKLKERIPGPGSYYHNDLTDLNALNLSEEPVRDHTQNSSSFASTTNRFNNFLNTGKSSTEAKPGPGKYLSINHSSSFTTVKKKHEKFQNFGRSSLRFMTTKDHTPGPGHFFKTDEILDSSTDPASHLFHPHRQQGGTGNYHPPFLSSVDRFANSKKEKENLSKKSELLEVKDIEDNLNKEKLKKKNEIQKKRYIKAPPFNSTTSRFRKLGKQKHVPGVGTYSVSDNYFSRKTFSKGIPKKKKNKPKLRKPGYNFNRSTPSIYDIGKTSLKHPGPGSYDTNKYSSFSSNKKRNKFLSEKRFFNFGEKKNVPGPGAYQNYNSSEKKSFRRKIPRVYKPKVVRRKPKLDVPGPGEYDLVDDWEKKSYNVSVL